jgi:hypothetical protein
MSCASRLLNNFSRYQQKKSSNFSFGAYHKKKQGTTMTIIILIFRVAWKASSGSPSTSRELCTAYGTVKQWTQEVVKVNQECLVACKNNRILKGLSSTIFEVELQRLEELEVLIKKFSKEFQ